MRFTREQYLDLMTFGHVERPMFTEIFGPLIGLPEEWIEQGASPDEIDLSVFDFDYVDRVSCGGQTGAILGPSQVIEDNDEYRVELDSLGRKMKLCKKTATLALPMNFPVQNMDDWLKVKHFFQFQDNRIDWGQVEMAKQQQAEGKIVVSFMSGAFDTLRNLMGEENACMAYFDQPELVNDILNTLRETTLNTLDPISDSLTIDILFVHEDFAGKSGPLVGPTQVNETFKPYYRAVWDMLASRGARLFDIDSDGNINPVLKSLGECGINVIHPVEPAAGMDPVVLRKQFGNQFAMYGGIDKFVLQKSKDEIRAELEYKMQPMMRQGGMIFALDHRIPNGTPLENYRYYVDLAREILELPPRKPGIKGKSYALRPGG